MRAFGYIGPNIRPITPNAAAVTVKVDEKAMNSWATRAMIQLEK